MTEERMPSNPLHPLAITAEDLKIDCLITRFNLYYGIIGRFKVLAPPTKAPDDTYSLTATVRMRNMEYRNETLCDDDHHLSDLGALPQYGTDSSPQGDTFIIFTENEVYLPSPLGVLADLSQDIFINEDR